MYKSILQVLKKYFRVCRKSGRIISIRAEGKKRLLFFPIVGILAIIWFLIRTVPKPSRAVYPCQRISAGIGVSFLSFIAGMFGSFTLFKKIKAFTKNISEKAALCYLILCVGAGLFTASLMDVIIAEQPVVYADWNPSDPPNSPIGTARGIHPGRVTWAHKADATANTPSGSWYQEGNTNQQVVNQMISDSINALAGETNNASAWDAIFRYFNQNHGKGNTGYRSGETIVIKINTVNTSSQSKFGSAIDATAEPVLAVADSLISQAGVPANNIVVYDGGVGTIGNYVYDCVSRVYPNVRFEAKAGYGSVGTVQWVDNGITYSGYTSTNTETRRVARCLWDAEYLINLALLKKHENQTAITLCGKNHFGSIQNCRDMHSTINDHINGMGTYNCLVDLLGHQEIGGKTLLFIIDGLWGAPQIDAQPTKWMMEPFNNDWPSSIFMSQDGVAIDSVGLDFLNAEWTLWDNADNYLHEAAEANNPPSGTVYDPENDGSRLQSLGVHEHWNNAQSKQYSRNLGTGNGIELVAASAGSPTNPPTVTNPPVVNTGDVNNDGNINIVDALLTAQFYVGINPQNFDQSRADTNCDGSINIVDALLIAQYSVGLIDHFC
jgi:uncharacterized protein (DUF362 family)